MACGSSIRPRSTAGAARSGSSAASSPGVTSPRWWLPSSPPSPTAITSSSLEGALDASLRRLQRETVDLYQIHFPFTLLRIRSLMNRLADAVATGKVRYVGVSNYSAAQMRTAHAALAERGVPLVSNQVNYSLLHRAPEENGVLETCGELEVTLIAYFPLARGVLTGKHQGGAPTPRGLRRFSALGWASPNSCSRCCERSTRSARRTVARRDRSR